MKTWAKKAVKKFGVDAQLGMVQEECAELIVAINKFRRSKNSTESEVAMANICEEIADVEIVTHQIRGLFSVAMRSDLVKRFKQSKIKKLVFLCRKK